MKRWHDLILEADFPWNIDEKYCEQAEWMMLLGSVLPLPIIDHALNARSNTRHTHGTDPRRDRLRPTAHWEASVMPDRFDTLAAARFPPIALPCACSLYMFLVQQTQYSHAM